MWLCDKPICHSSQTFVGENTVHCRTVHTVTLSTVTSPQKKSRGEIFFDGVDPLDSRSTRLDLFESLNFVYRVYGKYRKGTLPSRRSL